MNSNRVFHTSCLMDGEVYTYGGMTRYTTSKPIPLPLEKYSRATDEWHGVPVHESLVNLSRTTKFSAACSLST